MSLELQQRIAQSAQLTGRDGRFELTFQAMATRCRVSCGSGPRTAKEYAGALLDWVARFESRYSRFLPDSVISTINEKAGRSWVQTDPETDRILQLCHELNYLSRGALDPTALPLMKLWDWKKGVVPDESQVAAALSLVGWRKVQRAPGKVFLPVEGMGLDLGGIGKEYAVDYAAQMALEHGIESLIVDFGQDIRVFGPPAGGKPLWYVGLENPDRPGSCWTGLGLSQGAVATSGDYVRKFESSGQRFGHIIDPRTGRPASTGTLAVSVTAPSCTLAGALSTAAFVLGPQEGIALIDAIPFAEGCILTRDGQSVSRKFYEYVVPAPNNRR